MNLNVIKRVHDAVVAFEAGFITDTPRCQHGCSKCTALGAHPHATCLNVAYCTGLEAECGVAVLHESHAFRMEA